MCLVVTVGQGARSKERNVPAGEGKQKKGKWRDNAVSPAQKREEKFTIK
jgi:hypothetical protein